MLSDRFNTGILSFFLRAINLPFRNLDSVNRGRLAGLPVNRGSLSPGHYSGRELIDLSDGATTTMGHKAKEAQWSILLYHDMYKGIIKT